MTAVVGILNKQAIALAADSAVTIGGTNGRKIFNKANKVFTLSKRHPVGIMIYNSASFMATPWETIIKIYREQLSDQSFPTLNDYKTDFISFLKSKNYYTTPEIQIAFLENFSKEIIDSIIRDIANENRTIIDNPSEENRNQFVNLLGEKFDSLTIAWENQESLCNEFVDFKFELFEVYAAAIFERIKKAMFSDNAIDLPQVVLSKMMRFVHSVLRSQEAHSNYTGLIFCGFGEDEIYPQLIPINISMVVDNRLRYYINESRSASISNKNNGAVCPFAQTDVIDTILSGVDPSLDNIYLQNFDALFKKYNQAILESIGDENPLLSAQIQQLDTEAIVRAFNEMNVQIKRENYIVPLMNAVSSLSKDDLAEMAESLIYLTYLKRRITFAEESVGGPVDVAVISKGDGFVWIKRKHYFKPELNQHFFQNYFKV
jgi:hypothetical protein